MKSARLEAFSDGVIAIIITIMVLELKVPHEPTLAALRELWPTALSYGLSFVIVAIYWVNHHHLLHISHSMDARTMWANMNLLFWMSLIPFATGWMGENHFASIPTVVYASNLLACALAFSLLRAAISSQNGHDQQLVAIHSTMRKKNLIGVIIYLSAVVAAFFYVPVALALIALPAVMYFLPDKKVELIANRH